MAQRDLQSSHLRLYHNCWRNELALNNNNPAANPTHGFIMPHDKCGTGACLDLDVALPLGIDVNNPSVHDLEAALHFKVDNVRQIRPALLCTLKTKFQNLVLVSFSQLTISCRD